MGDLSVEVAKQLGTSVHHAHFSQGARGIVNDPESVSLLKSEMEEVGGEVETVGDHGLRFTKEPRFTREFFVGDFPFLPPKDDPFLVNDPPECLP